MPKSSTEFQTICIVLTSASGRGAGDLSRTLAERQWAPVIVGDALTAMAEAAIRVRANASSSGDGMFRAEPTIAMAICEQWMHEHVRDRNQLLQAICRYLPEVSLWAYEGEKLMPLRAEIDSTRAEREADVVITRREMDMLLNDGGERATPPAHPHTHSPAHPLNVGGES